MKKKIKLCIVTEFEQKNFFQWYIGLSSNSTIEVSSAILSENMLNAHPLNDPHWDAIREADVVFVYCVRHDLNWEWYKLPLLTKEIMNPNAKMICQFDLEFLWLFYPDHHFWKKEVSWAEGKTPKQFFEETGVMNVADAYIVLFNDELKKYTKKPVYSLQLPQLVRYKEFLYTSPSRKDVNDKSRKIAILRHSVKSAFIEHTLEEVIRKLNFPTTIFTSRNTDSMEKLEIVKTLPQYEKSVVYGNIPRDVYMDFLQRCFVAIDDNEGYYGWSRFVMECALAHVPCVGSTRAVKEFFPELYTKPKNYKKQKKLLKRLYSNKKFWLKMAKSGKKLVLKKMDTDYLNRELVKIIASIIEQTEKTKPIKKPRESMTKSVKPVISEISELKECKDFTILAHKSIPPRPSKGDLVMDNIHKQIINQEQWDIFYGKWRKSNEEKTDLESEMEIGASGGDVEQFKKTKEKKPDIILLEFDLSSYPSGRHATFIDGFLDFFKSSGYNTKIMGRFTGRHVKSIEEILNTSPAKNISREDFIIKDIPTKSRPDDETIDYLNQAKVVIATAHYTHLHEYIETPVINYVIAESYHQFVNSHVWTNSYHQKKEIQLPSARVIYDPHDYSRFREAAKPWEKRKIDILLVTPVTKWKINRYGMYEELKYIGEIGEKVGLKIVGLFTVSNEMERKFVESLPYETHINVPRKEISKYMGNAKIFFHPSPIECAALVAYESLNAGCFPIFKRAGAIKEQLGKVGVIYDELPDINFWHEMKKVINHYYDINKSISQGRKFDRENVEENILEYLCNDISSLTKKALFIIDVHGWAWDFMTRGIIKNLPRRWTGRKLSLDEARRIEWWKYDGVWAWSPIILPNCDKLLARKSNMIIGYYGSGSTKSRIKRGIKLGAKLAFICNKYHDIAMEIDSKIQDRFHVVHPAVDTTIFYPKPIQHEGFIVGWAGHEGWTYKRTYLLKQINFSITMAAEWGHKHFKEDRPWGEGMAKFYNSCDAYICVSRQEGIPQPILEAAAVGLPILSTDVGGISDFLDKEFLCPPYPEENVVKFMNKKLAEWKANPELAKEIGQRNLQKVLDDWNWRNRAKQIIKIMEKKNIEKEKM